MGKMVEMSNRLLSAVVQGKYRLSEGIYLFDKPLSPSARTYLEQVSVCLAIIKLKGTIATITDTTNIIVIKLQNCIQQVKSIMIDTYNALYCRYFLPFS